MTTCWWGRDGIIFYSTEITVLAGVSSLPSCDQFCTNMPRIAARKGPDNFQTDTSFYNLFTQTPAFIICSHKVQLSDSQQHTVTKKIFKNLFWAGTVTGPGLGIDLVHICCTCTSAEAQPVHPFCATECYMVFSLPTVSLTAVWNTALLSAECYIVFLLQLCETLHWFQQKATSCFPYQLFLLQLCETLHWFQQKATWCFPYQLFLLQLCKTLHWFQQKATWCIPYQLFLLQLCETLHCFQQKATSCFPYQLFLLQLCETLHWF